MSRQSGLGKGLGSLLPPPNLYETPKMEKVRTSEPKKEEIIEDKPSSKPNSEEIPKNNTESASVPVQNATNSANVGRVSSTQKNTESAQEAVVSNLVSQLLLDLTSDKPGISVIYKALNELVIENSLNDAVLVLDEPGIGRQVFTFDRRPLVGNDEHYLELEPGLYTSPKIEMTPQDSAAISRLCTVGLRIDLLKYDAWHDPMTGLYDRRSFDRLLEMAVARSVRYQWPFTLVLIDLDGFKELNDKQGHQAGDAVLKNIGDKFRQILRFGDNAARIGGDEFALILPETDPANIAPLLERAAMVTGDEPAIGFSYGLVICPNEADTVEGAFKLADERLYDAKAQRKASN